MFQLRQSLLYSVFLSLAACGGLNGGSSPESSFSPTAESAYCSQVQSHSPSLTIQTTAQYKARVIDPVNGLGGGTAARPIKYAEVQVLDSSGNIVQCGETSVTGTISVDIPKVAGTYTLKVLSRADNSHYKVSVLNNTSANVPYSISVAFTITGSEASPSAVTMPLADYNGAVKGGAFNILDQIFNANEYLRNNTACASCTTFTVAPKISVYWSPGISPGAYYGSPTTAISFFSKSDDYSNKILRGLYILGGISGDVDCSDTDHYDNSVILHEYGHFLEDSFAGSDSPGGSHDGNRLIDARLAWSEGWSNFVQAAIRGDSVYQDTIGNSDCAGSHGFGVDLDLEVAQVGQDKMGLGTPKAQGIFREISVSRALYDTFTVPDGDLYGANTGFSRVWQVFSSPPPVGMSGTSVVFRNMGLFNSLMRSLLAAEVPGALNAFNSAISSSNEFQDPADDPASALTREYAYRLTVQNASACPAFTIAGVLTTDGGVTNFLENEDFFQYYYDGTAANAVVTLSYAGVGGTPDDLDLTIYNKNHVYGNSATMASQSARNYPESGGAGIEVANLTGKSAGFYMINVTVDTDHLGGGTSTSYHLETNSGAKWLCP